MPVHRPGKHSGVFTYSDASLRRVKNSELAVIGKAEAIQKRSVMFTLTFPKEFSNHHRWMINDRFRKNIRMIFRDGGLWVCEAHTGKDYVDRKGNKVKGDPAMRGLVHFHYRVITDRSYQDVLEWIKRQQEKDGVAVNSYDVSEKAHSLYQSLYQCKSDQKDLVFHSGRIFATWGVDTKGMKVDQSQIDLFGYTINEKGLMKAKISDAHIIVQSSKLKK